MGGRGGSSGFGKRFKNPSEAMLAFEVENEKSGLFNKWQNYGKYRLYINAEKLYNLEITKYKTGNIADAKMDGEHISNSEARRILSEGSYIDVKTGEVHYYREETRERLEEVFGKKYRDYVTYKKIPHF